MTLWASKSVCVAAVLAALSLVAAQATPGLAAERLEIPIYQTVVKGHGGNGNRYWVWLKIGDGEAIKATLDTGSSGLMVLASGVAAADELPQSVPIRQSYSAGDVLTGHQTEAQLAIGEAQSLDAVGFGMITSASCVPQIPSCAAAETSFDDYRIQSEGYRGQGFQAILGVALGVNIGPNPLPNPLAALAGQWTIELPGPGWSTPGKIVLNPDEKDLRGYRLFDLENSARRWQGAQRSQISGCATGRDNGARLCGGISFDTGAGSLVVETADHDEFASIQTGGEITFKFGEGASALSWRANVPADAVHQSNITRGELPANIIIGYPFFWKFSVYYDYNGDRIGLRPR